MVLLLMTFHLKAIYQASLTTLVKLMHIINSIKCKGHNRETSDQQVDAVLNAYVLQCNAAVYDKCM